MPRRRRPGGCRRAGGRAAVRRIDGPSALVVALVAGLACLRPVRQPAAIVRQARTRSRLRPPRRHHLNQRLFNFSGNGRWLLWQAAWHQAQSHPLLGGGAGSFEQYWTQHRPVDPRGPGRPQPLPGDARRARADRPRTARRGLARDPACRRGQGQAPSVRSGGRCCVHRLRRACVGGLGLGARRRHARRRAGRRCLCSRGRELDDPAAADRLGAAGRIARSPHCSRRRRRVRRPARQRRRRHERPCRTEGGLALVKRSRQTGDPVVAVVFVGWRQLGEAQLVLGELPARAPEPAPAIAKDPRNWVLWLDLATAEQGPARQAALRTARPLNPLEPAVAGSDGCEVFAPFSGIGGKRRKGGLETVVETPGRVGAAASATARLRRPGSWTIVLRRIGTTTNASGAELVPPRACGSVERRDARSPSPRSAGSGTRPPRSSTPCTRRCRSSGLRSSRRPISPW